MTLEVREAMKQEREHWRKCKVKECPFEVNAATVQEAKTLQGEHEVNTGHLAGWYASGPSHLPQYPLPRRTGEGEIWQTGPVTPGL